MKVERVYLPGIFLPLRDVCSIARKIIESVMMAKCLSGIFLPSTNCKLAMVPKCISGSYLPSATNCKLTMMAKFISGSYLYSINQKLSRGYSRAQDYLQLLSPSKV